VHPIFTDKTHQVQEKHKVRLSTLIHQTKTHSFFKKKWACQHICENQNYTKKTWKMGGMPIASRCNKYGGR